MYAKMLKKDLMRKKVMNLILLVFILLATTFIAASVNNICAVLDGTNYFYEKSGLEDYFIITMKKENSDGGEDEIRKFLKGNSHVRDYSEDNILYSSKGNVKLANGKNAEISSSIIINCYDIEQQKFFDSDDKEITSMKDGTVYLPNSIMTENNIKPGDKISIVTTSGYDKEFKVVGSFKDALLGSTMMGTKRYLFSKNDFQELMDKSGLPEGTIFSVNVNGLKGFKNDYNKLDVTTIFSDDKVTVRITYVLDMVLAMVLMVVSVCLVIISAVMLKFIIMFTVNEDCKEIGIMKAIGIPDRKIRILYMGKYMVLAIVGVVAGFFISIPFSRIMLKQVTQTIAVRAGNSTLLLQAASSILLAMIIILAAYRSTKRIEKFTPMDAIRSGNNGERFKRKGILSLGKPRMRPTTFLACNDVLNEIKKYIVLFVTGMVGMWLVIMPANTINTLQSDKISRNFSLIDCDAWIVDYVMVTDCILSGDRKYIDERLDEYKKELEDNNIRVKRIFMEIIFRLKIEKGDLSYKSIAFQGIGTSADEYLYQEGTPPKYENEVALAYTTARNIDAHVGDTVKINVTGEVKEYVVTALYQCMNNMGQGIRFNENADLDYSLATGGFGVQVVYDGHYTKSEKKEMLEKMGDMFESARVQNMQQFISDMLGDIAGRVKELKTIILAVVLVVNVLVIVLMQKIFLIRERGEIGILKAIGFSTGSIIAWQTKRVSLVLAGGMIIGVLTSVPFSQITSGQVFKLMGADSIEFVVNPVEVYIAYPVIVFIAAVIMCIFTMLNVKKIKIQDMNNIE